MKHNPIILIALILGLILFGCKKHEQENITPKITNDKVEVTATTATFTWTVDWRGKLISVVEVSENEDMSHSQTYGSETETENPNFTVTAIDLKEATRYYYRHIVWNKHYVDNKFEMELKSFVSKAEWPNGRLSGIFSISDTEKVYFSQGNLQYYASTNTWRFAENQWDYIGTQTPNLDDALGFVGGTVSGSDNSNISHNYSGWIDLFGWGTSGWNSGANCYQPWSSSTNYYDYYPGGSSTNNLTGSYAKADWGVYNAISNGGNQAGQWRTLSLAEWVYVFENRSDASSRYGHGKVDGVCGMILLPDSWTLPSGMSFTQGSSNWANSYTADQWTLMEANGAVFLPAAGDRIGTSVYAAGYYGMYWSTSYYCGYKSFMLFGNNYLNTDGSYSDGRYRGLSVRLVAPAE